MCRKRQPDHIRGLLHMLIRYCTYQKSYCTNCVLIYFNSLINLKFHPKFERFYSHLPKFAIWTLFPPPLLVVVMKSAISRSMHFTLAK